MNKDIYNKLKTIKLVVLDVDGVLTDGSIIIDTNGKEYKKFNAQDGQGLKYLINLGMKVAIISGSKSNTIKHRAEMIGIEIIFMGDLNKEPILDKLCQDEKILLEQVLYIGDDLPDLPLIKKVGVGIAVSNAVEIIKYHAKYITKKHGGYGAVREVVDLILESQFNFKTEQPNLTC